MDSIETFQDLKDYAKHIDRQRLVLQFSPAFTPIEKIDLQDIFTQLKTIVSFKIAAQLDVFDAIEL
jgi:uncharacterized protein YqgV (UPF0045/DUF77 family)